MNCREVLPRINAYLDAEVSPSEKKLIQSHLATCQSCQQELESLGQLQNMLRKQLKTRAANAAPSVEAWSLVQASLSNDLPRLSDPRSIRLLSTLPTLPRFGSLGLQKVVIALLILLALVVSAPSVRARMESWVGSWFSFSSPDGEDFAAIGGFSAFTPYHATYLPEGFQHSGTGTITGWPDYVALELTYDHKNGQFFTLLESTGGDARALPSGEELQVGDSRAVFISNFATSSAELVAKIPILSIVTNFDYSNTNMLTWFMGEVKIEMFSNLPEDEMIRIAASLVPMQTSEGEQPKPPN